MTDNTQHTTNTDETQFSETPITEDTPDTSTGDDVSTLQKQIDELRASLARSQADYQNLVMRVDRDKAEMVHFLSAKIFTPLLTQLDHLDRAIQIKDGVTDDAFVDGVRSVQQGLQRYLESQGVKGFDSIGSDVDPDRHDVLSQSAGAEGVIIQEYERGYTLGDRVLRHAKVVVGNGEAEA